LPVATTATRRSRRKQTLGFGTAFLARFEENLWISVELSVSGRDCLKSAKHPRANCDWGNLLPTGHAGSRGTSFWTDLRHAQRRWDGDRPAPIARYQYCCVLNFYDGCLILRFRGESWRYCDAECCCNVAIVSLWGGTIGQQIRALLERRAFTAMRDKKTFLMGCIAPVPRRLSQPIQ
jgi:hypothetical protein